MWFKVCLEDQMVTYGIHQYWLYIIVEQVYLYFLKLISRVEKMSGIEFWNLAKFCGWGEIKFGNLDGSYESGSHSIFEKIKEIWINKK